MNIKIIDTGYDNSEPEQCHINDCEEALNALNYIVFQIGKLKFTIYCCNKHFKDITNNKSCE